MATPHRFNTNAPDGLPRWKEDLRLDATEAEQLYNMLFYVENQEIELETINMVMKVATYGAILEHILKKALKEPFKTSRDDSAGNPKRLDDLFKHHLEWIKGRDDKEKEVYPQNIYQFKIALRNINDKWNTLKHQLALTIGGGTVEIYYYLNVLVSYLSDTEIPLQNSQVAGFQIYKNALERLVAEEAQKEAEQKGKGANTQDKSQDIKSEISSAPMSPSKEKRMPIIVCIDASARMRQSGAYDGALEWVRVMADDYRGYGFVDVCLIVSNSDFCSVSSFDTLGELNYKIELLPPIDLGEGRTNLSQTIRKGLVSMERYMKIAQASVYNAKILVLTDSSEFVCSVLQENVSQICNSLNFPDEMRVDLYVYRYEQGRIDEKFKNHLQPFREALRCDAESLESMNVLDKGKENV